MKRLYFALLLSLLAFNSFSQLTVSGGLTAQQLAENLSGPNITVFNASLTGGAPQSGTFNFSGSNFEIGSGVILTSGTISNAVGPNNSSSTSGFNGGPGTPQLDALSGVTTFDGVTLQFDFTVQSSSIKFDYIFASEEYNEWVNTGFNDVFAFYISGPGIVGEQNIAVVPTTTDPVTINNINLGNYWQFYRNNDNVNTNIQFDGFTTMLTAKKDGLIPCNVYTLKLMIADGSDRVWDSGVFLKESSLVQELVSATTNTVTQDGVALEGCYDARFTFYLDKPQPTNSTISYQIGGTAINGVDYRKIDSSIIIPAGQTSATIVIDAYADGIPETQEIVELKYQPIPCAPFETVILYIDDNQPIEFSLSKTDLTCNGDNTGQIAAAITGGFGPYSVKLNDQTDYTTLPITGLSAGTYQVKVNDKYGCGGEAIVVGAEYDAGQTFLPDGQGNVYTSSLNITGFGAAETLTSANQLQSLCLTLEHSFMNDISMKLIAPNGQEITLKERPGGSNVDFGEPVANPGNSGGDGNLTAGKGYQYCFNNTPVYGTMVDESGNSPTHNYTDNSGNVHNNAKYLPSGAYQPYQSFEGLVGAPLNGNWTIYVRDHKPNDNGYIFNWSISFVSDNPGDIVVINQPEPIQITGGVTKAACGTPDGAINISVTGDNAPFTYLWNNNSTSQDISNVPAGSYTVTVTDNNSCSRDSTFLVSNVSALTINGIVNNNSCFQNNDGAIDITVGGGTNNYTYAWSNGASTQDLTGLSIGNYIISVTDNNTGCIALSSFDITEPEVITTTATVINEKCGDHEGSIALLTSGGNGNYTFYWSNGQTASSIQDLQAGPYSVFITDSRGCSLTKIFSIINEVGDCIPDCDLTVSTNSSANETCGQANGGIDISISTTHGPYTVSWSNGLSSEDLSNLVADTYTVNISDNVGCTASQSFTIQNMSGTLSTGTAQINNEQCGNGGGMINITPTGGAGGYSFQWSNGAVSEDINNLSAGSYSVVITDATNCSITKNYSITNESGSLKQTFGYVVNEVCGNSVGSIDINISGGVAPYSYAWSNGATSQDQLNLSKGTYSCVITDNAGCSISTPTYNLENEAGTLAISFIDVDNELCDDDAGAIQLLVTGGNAPYTYAWSNGASTALISNLNAGTYSATVTTQNGCQVSTGNIVLIDEPGTLQIDNIFTTHENCGNGAGAIDVALSGGSGTYTYQWSNGQTTQDITGLSKGSYTSLITDSQGCSLNFTVAVNNNPGTLAITNVAVTNNLCGTGNGAIDLTVTGGTTPYTFAWSTGATTEDISNQPSGTHYYSITDAAGCNISSSAIITGSMITIENVLITNETCGALNGVVTLAVAGGSGDYTYLWSNGATTANLLGISGGAYSCFIEDSQGCSITSSPFIVNGNSGNLVATNQVTGNTCDLTITVSVTGGTQPYNYSWSSGATSQNISVIQNGTYTCTITDANGLCTKTTAVVNNLDAIYYYEEFGNSDCGTNVGYAYVNYYSPTIAFTYLWSTGATTNFIDNLGAGIYTCVITSSSGCTYNKSFTIESNPIEITESVTPDYCNNNQGAIDITVTGGTSPYYYYWFKLPFYEYLGGAQDITGLGSGDYLLYVYNNSFSCYISKVISVSANPLLAITGSQVTNDNCGTGNGAINLTVSGGQQPYTYAWSNGQTTQALSNLVAGTYYYTITDQNNCTLQSNATISANSPININQISVTDDHCLNHVGAIDIGVTGGSGNFSYQWSTGATTDDVSNLTEGTYSIVVTDNLTNCSASSQFFVGNNANSMASQFTSVNTLCGVPDGSIDLTVLGGSGNYTFNWSSGQTSEDLSNMAPGVYTCTITDVLSGCSFQAQREVLDSQEPIAIQLNNLTSDFCALGNGEVKVSVSGGINNAYSYQWSNGVTSQNIEHLTEGSYILTVTSGLTCSAQKTFIVGNIISDLASQVTSTAASCGLSNGSINLAVSGGSGNYTFDWSNGQTSEDLSNLLPGIYTCIIKDELSNCSITIQREIQNPNTLVSTVIITNDVCATGTGAINLSVAGGTTPYTYEWSTGDKSEDLTNRHSGTYHYTITDAAGCSISSSATITESVMTIENTSITHETCGEQNGAIAFTISGGSSGYTYLWSNGATTANLSGISAGSYSCVIKDSQGCSITSPSLIVNNNSDVITIDAQIKEATCKTCNDGEIKLSLSDEGPFTFSWSNEKKSKDISGLLPGDYTVTIVASEGSKICTLSQTFTVGFNESNSNSIILYPNPSKGIIYLENQTGDKEVTVNIINALGEVVFLKTYSFKEGSLPVDISILANGAYNVQIRTKSQQLEYKLLLSK